MSLLEVGIHCHYKQVLTNIIGKYVGRYAIKVITTVIFGVGLSQLCQHNF